MAASTRTTCASAGDCHVLMNVREHGDGHRDSAGASVRPRILGTLRAKRLQVAANAAR
jgi:hypothetical protein